MAHALPQEEMRLAAAESCARTRFVKRQFRALILIWALWLSTSGAAEPLARCYLMGWDIETRSAPHPAEVRQWADARCSVRTAAELARFKTILRLEHLYSAVPMTRDLRFVVDIRAADGAMESYYADRFFLMSAYYTRSRKIDGGFRREMDRFVQAMRENARGNSHPKK
jgi:hypothetical protein